MKQLSFIVGVVLALVAVPAACAAAYSPAELFLRAWYPEVGSLDDLPPGDDSDLAAVARAARLGRFREAERRLSDIESRVPEIEAARGRGAATLLKYRVLSFRRELLQVRAWPIGGGFFLQGEGALHNAEMNPEWRRLTAAINEVRATPDASTAREIASAEQYVAFTWECVITETQTYRAGQLNAEKSGIPNPADPKKCDQLEEALDTTAVSKVTRQLLFHGRRYRVALAAWQFPMAKQFAEEAVKFAETDEAATVAAWRRYRGDAASAPYGSPLTYGIDLASQYLAVGPDGWPIYSRAVIPPTAADIAEARKWYSQVQPQAAEDLLRAAYLDAMERGMDNAHPAFRTAATAAAKEGDLRVEAMARGTAGLLSGTSAEYETALKLAEDEKDFGCIQSLASLASSMSLRNILYGSPSRSLLVADTAAPTLYRFRRLRMAADVFAAAKIADFNLNREESFLYHLSSEVQAVAAWNQHIEDVLPTLQLGADGPRGAGLIRDDQRLIQGLYTLGTHYWAQYYKEGLPEWLELERGTRALLAQVTPRIKEAANVLTLYDERKQQITASAARLSNIATGDCQAWVSEYHKAALPRGDLDEWRVVAMHAAECDAQVRREVLAALRGLTPIADARAAIEQTKRDRSDGNARLNTALGDIEKAATLAFRLRDRARLEEWTRDACELYRQNTDMILAGAFHPHCQLFQAWTLLLQNDGAAAAARLDQIVADEPFWTYNAIPTFRIAVATARTYAAALMNDAPAALQHLQWLRRESVRAERIKTGIDAELLRSLTLATLLRDAALGRTTPVELQSIIDLRSQFRLSSAASVQRPELAEIRGALARLPADTVLLAYAPLPTEDGFMVWRVESATSPAQAAGPDITFRVVRCPLYQFERSAKALQSLVVNGEPGALRFSDELYKVLFGNIAPIPRGKTLAVWFVGSVQPPFELLGPDAEHMFLGANPVVYLADLIGPPDNPAPDRRKAVIIGHPGTALAGVARETAEIARILKLPDGVADPPAADAARLLAGSRIIHVAAHSVIDHRNPLRSLIELKDGSLEAWQMADSTRGTDLIVLSACDTRRGPDWGGTISLSAEEAPSLSSAVSLGGARTVLSSSSPVDDSVSADLMIDFYTLLDDTPAQALFRARQRALARDIAPVRIANFVLSARDLESLSVSFATPRR